MISTTVLVDSAWVQMGSLSINTLLGQAHCYHCVTVCPKNLVYYGFDSH